MKLRTEINFPPVKNLIGYDSAILSIGSCFADNIGYRLENAGFNIVVNPFGILYNPFSILNVLIESINGNIDSDLFTERNGHFFHHNYHSDLYAESIEALTENIKLAQEHTTVKLLKGNILQITFGTASVYQLASSGKIVGNCHKVPQKEFNRTLLNLDIIRTVYTTFFNDIFKENKKLKVILSVSPIRHTKDGLSENNISKSVLHLLCDHLRLTFDNVHYFPAYEMVIDDLRDYRFYKEDLVHPSDQAISYVYDNYKNAYFSDNTHKIVALSDKIQKAENHYFMHASEGDKRKHHEFVDRLREELSLLIKS